MLARPFPDKSISSWQCKPGNLQCTVADAALLQISETAAGRAAPGLVSAVAARATRGSVSVAAAAPLHGAGRQAVVFFKHVTPHHPAHHNQQCCQVGYHLRGCSDGSFKRPGSPTGALSTAITTGVSDPAAGQVWLSLPFTLALT